MIVAITGGTGFIGKKLAQLHLARGDQVRVLSRAPVASDFPLSVVWHKGDLAGDADLSAFVDQADLLYHCAGEIRDESRMQTLHVEGTRRLIEAASHNIGRWVQLSSVGVYGQPRTGQVTEQSPLQPHGTYEITKNISDDLVLAAGTSGAFEWTILRPSIVFGEGMPNQSLYQLIKVINQGNFFFIGRPGASANYIHVDNVVEALAICGILPAAKARIYNLSDYATLEEFVGMIARALGREVPEFRLPEWPARAIAAIGTGLYRRFPLTPSRIDAMTTRVRYPIGAIQAELGYKHAISLESGISRLVNAWRMQQCKQIQQEVK